jgi:signal transduction histidine kinase
VLVLKLKKPSVLKILQADGFKKFTLYMAISLRATGDDQGRDKRRGRFRVYYSITVKQEQMKKVALILLFAFVTIKLFPQINIRDTLKLYLANSREDTTKVNLLSDIGFSYAFEYEDTAIMYATEGLELARKIGYKQGEGSHLGLLAISLFLAGNYTLSLKYNFELLNLAQKLKDTLMIGNALDLLGLSYREQEDYKEALKYEYQAEVFSRNLKPQPGQFNIRGNVLGNIASILERDNRPDSALYYGKKAFQIIKDWSGLYLYLGNIYAKLGKPDSAFFYYRTGVPIAVKNLIYIDLLDIYNQMSRLFESAGKKDSAIFYARRSITSVGPNSYPEGKLRAMSQLAALYESEGEKDSTIKYLKLSTELREKLFNREKTRESQSLAFNDRLHQQDLAIRKEKEKSTIRIYVSLAVIIAVLAIAFIQWRNNKQKQKAKTKIEKAYEELKTTQQQLIQSEKMASLGELTAGIAHEIQNPLNFVNNFSEVNKELLEELKNETLKVKSERDEKIEVEILNNIVENEEKIIHHGKRAEAIVKSMLQHSKTSSGKIEPTEINALCDEYLRLAYHGLRAKDKSFNAGYSTDFDGSIGKLNIVPQDIGRALLNLYNNAFYAVCEKQKQNIPGYEAVVSVSTNKNDGKIEIKVKDNGDGIPQRAIDKIFQPFFTTKSTGQGTGLGLSLSYDIIKAHGGELKVETKENEGAEFIIQMPAQ